MYILKRILLICLICLFASPVWGKAHIGVWPVKVFLWPDQKIGEVHLTNKGKTDANLQISAKSWDMDENGKFIEADTGDFVFYPRLMTIPAGGKSTLRVGYNSDFPKLEKPYRLFIQELPPIHETDQTKKEKMSAGFLALLRLSLPLFVSPSQETPSPRPVIDGVEITDEGVRVPVKNPGTHNFLVIGVTVTLLGKDKAVLAKGENKRAAIRVLPQRRRLWDIPMDTGKRAIAQSIRISLDIQDLKKPFEKTLPVKPDSRPADKKE
ncbi:MAG: molecular chaperone [bacterium]|nr:molecular chaperone [bacterium]